MTAQIIDIDEHRPHLVIDCSGAPGEPAGAIHVVPVALAVDWGTGAKPLPEDEIVRRIIREWLCFMCPEIDYPPLEPRPAA